MLLIVPYIFYFVSFFSLALMQECPPADTMLVIAEQEDWNIPPINSWDHLEIMTWNVKTFPLNGNTLNDVQEIIYDLLPDIINFQELNSQSEHEELEALLPAYEFVMDDDDPYYGLDIAYRKDCVSLIDYETLFNGYGYEFAWRYPLSANFVWSCGESFLEFQMIDVHFKCCTDGFDRRLASSEIMSDYLDIQTANNKNIIVAGDYNDSLDDPNNDNSLLPLINNTTLTFVDFDLAEGSTYNWSYPSYPSHIDHILINSNLSVQNTNSIVSTIRIDDYTGYNFYQNNISDHRPVYWKAYISSAGIPEGLVINEIMNNPGLENETSGEWFELTNLGTEIIDIFGLTIKDNDFDYHTINQHILIEPDDFIVLGSSSLLEENGNINIDYEYDNFNLSNLWDEIIISHPANIILDEVIYSSQDFPNLEGRSMMLSSPDLDNNQSNSWEASYQEMDNGDFGTPGSSNISYCMPQGDINSDSITNVLDVVLLVGHILNGNIFDSNQECQGDMDQDGTINVVDIVLVVSYILN